MRTYSLAPLASSSFKTDSERLVEIVHLVKDEYNKVKGSNSDMEQVLLPIYIKALDLMSS